MRANWGLLFTILETVVSSKTSKWQEVLLHYIISNDIQVSEFKNKKSLIITIFCSTVSMPIIKSVPSFQHCGMLITYFMGGEKRTETPISKYRRKILGCSWDTLEDGSEYFEIVSFTRWTLPFCNIWGLYCFQCLQGQI